MIPHMQSGRRANDIPRDWGPLVQVILHIVIWSVLIIAILRRI